MPHHSLRLQVPCNSVHLSWLYGLCHRKPRLYTVHIIKLLTFLLHRLQGSGVLRWASVCLSCMHLRNTRTNFTKFSVQATRGRMARSFSDGAGIRYVFLVWWMMSNLPTDPAGIFSLSHFNPANKTRLPGKVIQSVASVCRSVFTLAFEPLDLWL